MNKETLSSILEGKLFCIPDYQRGYAWELKQWNDFVTDVDALIDDEIKNHYTGTIVIYQNENKPTQNYGVKRLEIVDIVDGQQRLTTCCLYLSIIINELINNGLPEFENEKSIYLYHGAKCKLQLNNDTVNFFFDLLTKGTTNTVASTVHQKRLNKAYDHLKNHIVNQLKTKANPNEYLQDLFYAITRKLNFTFYKIEKESEIGMTFELMNSRGQDLSILELLKNYLMHWIYRNIGQKNEQEDLTSTVNKAWKEVYTNIPTEKGNEDQCLRIAWTLYCTHTPKYWEGYIGFKKNWVIPLRDFSQKDKKRTQEFISNFATGLAEISKHYALVVSPTVDHTTEKEYKWLTKIHHAGNIANFLPLIVASKIKFEKNVINENQYISVLESLELYSYRVFLYQGRRSNAGISTLYRWAFEVFTDKIEIENLVVSIKSLINWYSNENDFQSALKKSINWYSKRGILKYTLFEYELQLLKDEGKNMKPKLLWNDLNDSTIEHILPQTPDERSHWKEIWSEQDVLTYLHDIGNLSLTVNNSNYKNFDFERKRGKPGQGICYANSDIRQERKLSVYSDWTAKQCENRHKEISNWIIRRWGVPSNIPIIEVIDEEDDSE